MGFFLWNSKTDAEKRIVGCCERMKLLLKTAYYDKSNDSLFVILKDNDTRLFFEYCPYCASNIKTMR